MPHALLDDVDDDDEAVRIMPLQAAPASNPDLSMVTTRSVASVHLQYLHNIGVKASLSVSIVIDDELRGLIACHHSAPRWLEQEIRSTLDMLGLLLSLQIDAFQRSEIASAQEQKQTLLQSTLASINPESRLHEEIKKRISALRQIIHCDGVGLWIDGEWHAETVALSVDQTSQLIFELDNRHLTDAYSTRSIAGICSSFAEGASTPAGVLVIPISQAPRTTSSFSGWNRLRTCAGRAILAGRKRATRPPAS